MKPFFFPVRKCHRLVSKQTSNCPFAQETVGMGIGFGNVVNLETESQCHFPKETSLRFSLEWFTENEFMSLLAGWTFAERVTTDNVQSLLCWGVSKFS